jgi:hypothetical protein
MLEESGVQHRGFKVRSQRYQGKRHCKTNYCSTLDSEDSGIRKPLEARYNQNIADYKQPDEQVKAQAHLDCLQGGGAIQVRSGARRRRSALSGNQVRRRK